MSFVLMSLDTAYDEKQENDPSACTVWGVWTDLSGHTRLMLMYAWQERLEFPELVRKIIKTAEQYKVDRLLIEAKASGKSVAQEIRRMSAREDYGVTLMDPKGASKLARASAVTHIWENGLIYAPDETEYRWADEVITQFEEFPRAKHDDLVDSGVYAITYLRDSGMLKLPEEIDFIEEAEMQYDSTRGGNALSHYYD
jgi:predicted phage terminase large subunit-like protein